MSHSGRDDSTHMSEIGRVLDHIAAEAIGAPLKAAAFRRSGRTWRREVGDAVQVVPVQASRHNAGAEGGFVLNAGARDQLARRGPLWWAAAASLELGDHAAARRLYAEAVAGAAPPKAKELRRWGRAHGLEG